jgi:hypothetical protein
MAVLNVGITKNLTPDYNLMYFSIDDFYIETAISRKIKRIEKIVSFDKSIGYMVFIPEGFGGEEEYITIADIMIDLDMGDKLDWLKQKLSNVTEVIIKEGLD